MLATLVAILKEVHFKGYITEVLEPLHKYKILGFEMYINPLMPELSSSVQRCLMRFFYWGFWFLDHAFRSYMR
jgi:hypothetical protein